VPNKRSPRENLASIVSDFRLHGKQTAVTFREGLRLRSASYIELAELSGRFAAELSRRQIVKGDRVVLWAPNGPEWIAAFFGCVLRGVLPVPLDDAGSLDFASRIDRDVQPKLIVASSSHARALQTSSPLLTIDGFDSSLPSEPDLKPIADLGEQDPLQIVFTSGTTGDPKGIVHTHGNVLASLRPIEHEIQKYLKYERIFHPLRFLHTLPLSHVFGQFMGLWIPPLIAAEVHFEDRLIATELIERIHSRRISVVAAVPRVLELLREYLRQRVPDLEARRIIARGASAWKRWWIFRDVHRLFGLKFWAMICGGAALPADLEEFWNSMGFLVVQGYGMTETTALVSVNHPFRASQGSLGQVLPGREIKVTDEGEVLVRGATVSNTTWQAGKLEQRDSEWLSTGDLGELDASGNLRFRGRKKDVIVTAAGLNIHPDDLEAALLRQPEIKACAVIETQGQYGPEPFAAIVSKSGDPAAAVANANATLADYQQIRRWTVWPEPDLPRTSTGKVLRREVARVVAGSGTQAGAGSLAAVLQCLGHNTEGAGEGDELNLDSLARVELQVNLEEQFGAVVDDAAIQNVRTVADLRKILGESRTASPSEQPAGAGTQQQPRQQWAQPGRQDQHAYPFWPWAPPVRFFRAIFIELVMRAFVFALAKPKVDSEVPFLASGPFLIYANHVTAVDVALMLYALPPRVRRHVAVAMSGEIILAWRRRNYYNYRFLNWLSPLEYLVVTACFNVFPLPQHSGFRRSFAHAAKAMDRGYSVIVFPEGRRAEDEQVQKFMSGSGLLWSELHCPALPVYLGGLGELKRTGESWFRSRKLSVHIGAPISPQSLDNPEKATGILESALRELAGRASTAR
jgi:long-chain acyl-CoA synthetase